MDVYPHLYSEEDIRTKVVTAWLMNHGFGSSDISVEYSFEIRLGRKILSIDSEKAKNSSSQIFRPRADVLVRRTDGKNLLIVEVKAPDEPLDDNVKEQGICYARLLRKGGIAPFVILTNGYETKIYDTITEELINGKTIPLHHPYVEAGFRVSVDDIAVRAEAIETFISLSSDNLIHFCRQQVAYRMRFLKDEDPYSGKKYIPSLYIERKEAKGTLVRLLDEEKRRVVIVVGPPQAGKTNFICHTVEERLERGLPCLFYPAIGMGKGLLEAICEDFEWIFGDGGSIYHIVHHKLQRILNRTHQKLSIFIDGWNEADLTLARTIDRQSERISSYDIACVISMTDVAADRLLKDEVGNPSYITEAVGISVSEIPLFEKTPEEPKKENKKLGNSSSKWSRVFINRYSGIEVQEAYQRYAEIFNVQVAGLTEKENIHDVWSPRKHKFVEDPFLLRIGMEQFRGQVLPLVLEEPDLLAKSIELKSSRAIDLRDKCVPEILSHLADEMFSNDAPVRQSIALKRWGLPIVDDPPKGLFEAALLSRVRDHGELPAIDFYYGRERDFVVACWAREWCQKVEKGKEALVLEFSLAIQTIVGTEALRWFFNQARYAQYLRSAIEYLQLYEKVELRRILLSSLYKAIKQRNIFIDKSWLLSIIRRGVSDQNMLIRVETSQFLGISMPYEILVELATDEELLMNLLMIDNEHPFKRDRESVGFIVLDAIHDLHSHLVDGDSDKGSEVTDTLFHLTHYHSSSIRSSAAKVLGYVDPDIFLQGLSHQILSLQLDEQARAEYIKGVEMATVELQERYYGGAEWGCPVYLDILRENEGDEGEPNQLSDEYVKMCKICIPVIAVYSSKTCGLDLLKVLKNLQPEKNILRIKELPNLEQMKARMGDIAALRYQLPLPFEGIDTNRKGN